MQVALQTERCSWKALSPQHQPEETSLCWQMLQSYASVAILGGGDAATVAEEHRTLLLWWSVARRRSCQRQRCAGLQLMDFDGEMLMLDVTEAVRVASQVAAVASGGVKPCSPQAEEEKRWPLFLRGTARSLR